MTTAVITNEILYELLKEFKNDVHRRFENIEKKQSEDHKILMDLWENRDRQKINFSATYFIVTVLTSTLLAYMIGLIR